MSTSNVLRLEEYRGRRDVRFARTSALHGADESRSTILTHLGQVLSILGADRAAILWVDEYGPGAVHPYLVLDLASEAPRRAFSSELLTRTWSEGVPGFLDLPELDPMLLGRVDGPRSHCSVSFGSDGVRAWFLAADAWRPRSLLAASQAEALMFRAGECASILLHRDMDRGADRGGTSTSTSTGASTPERFTAWSVLQDIEGDERDEERSRRIACRFLVARMIRSVVDDDLVTDPESLSYQLQGVGREIADWPTDDPEGQAWEEVLRSLESADWHGLGRAVLTLGERVEDQGHTRGSVEFYEAAVQIASAMGHAGVATDAARFRGRVARRRGEWADALRWYAVARRMAEVTGDSAREALVLDGIGHLQVSRGNFPEAQAILTRALAVARGGADPDVRGSIHFTLMTLAHTAGDLAEAARQGWRSFRAFEEDHRRLRALTALGGVFLEARALEAAEDAFSIVEVGTEEAYYRLYALEGLAHVAARKGDRVEFEKRLQRVDDAGFEQGTPDFKAEAFLERGDSYLHLGDEDLARGWYRKAVTYAEDHEINEYLMRAENALHVLERERAGATADRLRSRNELELSEPEMEGMREDLRVEREALSR